MLHDKLIAENFVRQIQNDNSLSPETIPITKMDILYNNNSSYCLSNEQEKQRIEECQVLDLSRRYESSNNDIISRKTPSPYENNNNLKSSVKTSPSTTTLIQDNYDTLSSSTPTGKTLAASIQKLYAQHHSMISSTTNSGNNLPSSGTNSIIQNQLFNNSQGFPIYHPMYYPQIKRERDLSPSSSQSQQTKQQFIVHDEQQQQQQLPVFPQGYHPTHANLIHSFNLIKASGGGGGGGSYPEHIISNLKSPSQPSINISPRLEDKLSEGGSNPGSPSSTSVAYYSKLKKAKSLITIDQHNQQQHHQQQQQQSKPTRPFKAYPRDPTVIAANFAATDSLYDNSKVERYSEYRKRILEQIRSANGGERTISNPKMRRTNNNRKNCSTSRSDESNSDNQMNNSESEDRTGDSDNDSMMATGNDTNLDKMNNNNNDDDILNKNNGNINIKDAAYFERRRKNNAAAKKSRDRRRIKEDEIAIRAAYLERQNIELLCQLESLKTQLAALTKNSESRF